MLYDFYNGKAASYLKKITKSAIKKTSKYRFEPITNIVYGNIKKMDKRFFYSEGEDTYLMFAYKNRYSTVQYGLPRYHVCQCKTREEYSGYIYSNAMPVEIYCKDQKKTLEDKKSLPLCANCVSASQRALYAFLAKGKPWFEYVLEYANSDNEMAKKTKRDGYVKMWKQISEAYRERTGFHCESCRLNLREEKYYLEVHHGDYNKTNNAIENLSALCVLCHATVDETHLSKFKKDNSLRVATFIDDYSQFVKANNVHNLEKWLKG
ncbi:HNH endonuclease [Aestuariibaculum sp. M13]|uniref:HNH endonuclease n=1 Tax=Aestuariibaculum sp. M13 TaxID=2967132 RepID=UPI00215A0469|nr:HNH endonuclease signature motif containing protein [Aestuariibaculum sp. M13]MCR8666221.1 HNH endonuclease [Aestuariibaculum sp. M13]